MVETQFEAILRDLEPILHCTLKPDTNNACLVRLRSGLLVQFELNRQGHLLIGVKLGAIPSSQYLENILREALKANYMHSISTQGIFGYSKKSNQLILFATVDNRNINTDLLASVLGPFLIKAQAWADAIGRGDVPSASSEEKTGQVSNGLFGLIR